MKQSFDTFDKHKVILGLSGGVDSTTAALLLRKSGYQVTGLYFDVAEENKEGRKVAEETARQLGIPFIYRNVHDLFQSVVSENFCREYLAGRTPNPCIICNPAVKFKLLTEEADKAGAYYIATGHYAKAGWTRDWGWTIQRAASGKDQSYMLYRLGPSVIQRLLLPLSELENKEETREIARKSSMQNAEQKDSQEICFLQEGETYKDYIRQKGYPVKEGAFVNKGGEILGQHKGLVNYTIGQRKGLGITFGKPVFVTRMDKETNTVTLGDHEDLFSREVLCSGCYFPATDSSCMPEGLEGIEVLAKVRYAAKPAPAVIKSMPDGRIKAFFEEKQRAATPGQSLVFYKEDCVVGGGFID